jgi:pimeloyl-ACP methyl ester carboxylesterase
MTPTGKSSSAWHPRRYWLRLLRLFVVAVAAALVILPVMLGVVSMYALTHPPCSPGGSPASINLPFEDITLTSTNDLKVAGYFIPGTNGAAIIIPPAYSGGRGSSLHYARVFNQAGFAIVLFESRVCTAQGWISLGYQETDDVEAAYRYLLTRPDVDPTRVGLHGFSSAGATSLMVMARMPQIRAASAEGGYHDYNAVFGTVNDGIYFDKLYRWAALLTYRLITGGSPDDLSPISTIPQIGPRPVLLVYGSRETSLPGARQMLARAQESGVPAELWVVEGAGHGNYLSVAPEEFVRRVVGFHLAALAAEPG